MRAYRRSSLTAVSSGVKRGPHSWGNVSVTISVIEVMCSTREVGKLVEEVIVN